METTIKIIHIIAGAIALFSGLSAILLSSKTKLHKPIGKLFAYAMTGVFVTAIYLAVLNGIDFLFCIAILSYFSVIVGVRALKFLKGKTPSGFDWFLIVALIAAGLYLGGKGLLATRNEFTIGIVLYLFFGAGMIGYGFLTASEFVRTKPGSSKWFTLHQSNMGAALIATITAFCTTTMAWLPSILEWILPSLILSPMLTIFIKRYQKNHSSSRI